ncbi:DoxX family protein [Paenibacillus soyae]|uniref:DoxX family protein n=1 Tax=Paenibacillus soyae TaxID=2969249 RepID=A0A9X2MS90_9BACL|nr:DoxX family protein [Paenibacillus soyae]MCR2805884.1 DoxX family protein [Paenibacillus soyae]
MLPFYTLVASFLLFKGLGQLGLTYFEGWQTSLQGAVAVMLLLTASAHWGTRRPDLIRMVPPVFSRPDFIVTVTGCLEVAGAVCILIPSLSKAASIGLALLLAFMFPANVIAAREGLTIGGRPVPKLLHRTALQVIFVGAILLAG